MYTLKNAKMISERFSSCDFAGWQDVDGRLRGHLFDGYVVGDEAPRAGLPLRPAPAERRDLTGQGPGDHRGQPGPDPGVLPDTTPGVAGERAVPGLGNGS
jgi:hypothetical protein